MPSTVDLRALCAAMLVTLVAMPAAVHAQLPRITIDRMDARRTAGTIQLTLGAKATDAQKKAMAEAQGWSVESIETATGAMRTLPVETVAIHPSDLALTLDLAPVEEEWLDTSTHTISVTLLRSANLARGVSAPTAAVPGGVAKRRFVAAPTVAAANVYFSGKITATDNTKPRYSVEARLKDDWEMPRNSGHLGYMAEVFADEATDADPDRISASATYRRVIDPRPRGLILHAQPIAGEFARKAPRTTTILTTAHVEHVLLPTTGSAKAKGAMVVFGGVEIGNNFANAIDKDNGSGFVTRVRVVANPFVILKPANGPFKTLKGSAFWDARFLANEEIDPGRPDARGLPTLTRRARHHLKVDLDLGLNDFVSLTIQHRYGYLPPVYKKVSPTISLSLTFKGKWT